MSNDEIYREWKFGNHLFLPGPVPRIMGIVNVTPDSFSDGGQYQSIEDAVGQAMQLVQDGADILDIGGESTRPGAEPVPVEEELRRVIPVIEQLATMTSVPISIDTYKSEVARQALRSGAQIVNDVSGLLWDDKMVDVCLEQSCGIVCMHTQGTPKTMQQDPRYHQVVDEIIEHLAARLDQLEKSGIARERVVIDPGIGFGKTAGHNLEILTSISRLQELDRPVLVGHSRKRFLQKILGHKLDERSYGTVGVSIALAQQNVDILRVHDVSANRDAIIAWQATLPAGLRSPLS